MCVCVSVWKCSLSSHNCRTKQAHACVCVKREEKIGFALSLLLYCSRSLIVTTRRCGCVFMSLETAKFYPTANVILLQQNGVSVLNDLAHFSFTAQRTHSSTQLFFVCFSCYRFGNNNNCNITTTNTCLFLTFVWVCECGFISWSNMLLVYAWMYVCCQLLLF